MTLQEFEQAALALRTEALRQQRQKRPAYTIGSPDVLANFKRVADRVGITPGQVLSVYMLKHVDAVTSALCHPELPQAEAILGRFADNMNYLELGYALLQEQADHTRQLEGAIDAAERRYYAETGDD